MRDPATCYHAARKCRHHPHFRSVQIPSIVLFLLLVSFGGAIAQQRLDPVAIGMGKASVATARGLSALSSSIGALGLDELGRYDSNQHVEVDVSVLPVGGSAGSTYLNHGDLNFVFDKKDSAIFTDADRLRISSLLEEGRLSADAAVDLFALRIRAPRIGALGVHYTHRVRAQMSFPEDFRTGVLGSGSNDLFNKDQLFRDPEIGGEWTRSLTVVLASSWERINSDPKKSTWFPTFGVGMSMAYVEGIVHFDVDPKSRVTTQVLPQRNGVPYQSIQVDGHYTFRSSEPIDPTFSPSDALLNSGLLNSKIAAGSGWEGGFGLAMVVLRKANISDLEITGNPLEAQQIKISDRGTRDALLFGIDIDGIGSLEWAGKNRERNYANIHDTVTNQLGGISNKDIYRYEAKLDTIGAFRTQLPTTLRLGLGADITAFLPDIPGDLLTSFETAFDMNHAIGGERNTRYSFGAEWRPTPGFIIRTGAQFGGRIGAAMALGVGLRPFRWLTVDLGSSEITSLFFADRRRIDFALRLATKVTI
ncbi:MAG: hypothetical protein ABI876_03575 [Bacteroidota bacterium]